MQKPVAVAARSKASVYSRSIAGMASLNRAERVGVCYVVHVAASATS